MRTVSVEKRSRPDACACVRRISREIHLNSDEFFPRPHRGSTSRFGDETRTRAPFTTPLRRVSSRLPVTRTLLGFSAQSGILASEFHGRDRPCISAKPRNARKLAVSHSPLAPFHPCFRSLPVRRVQSTLLANCPTVKRRRSQKKKKNQEPTLKGDADLSLARETRHRDLSDSRESSYRSTHARTPMNADRQGF